MTKQQQKIEQWIVTAVAVLTTAAVLVAGIYEVIGWASK
jgi:hypothetical protein